MPDSSVAAAFGGIGADELRLRDPGDEATSCGNLEHGTSGGDGNPAETCSSSVSRPTIGVASRDTRQRCVVSLGSVDGRGKNGVMAQRGPRSGSPLTGACTDGAQVVAVVTVLEVLVEVQGSTSVEGEVEVVESLNVREATRMHGRLTHHVEAAAAVERYWKTGRAALALGGQETPSAATRAEDMGRAGRGQALQFPTVLQFGAWKPFVEERRGMHH